MWHSLTNKFIENDLVTYFSNNYTALCIQRARFSLTELNLVWHKARNMYSSNPTAMSRMRQKVIFKRSTAGFKSEFSFSQTGWRTKATTQFTSSWEGERY